MRRLQKRPGGIHRTNLYRRGRRGGRQLSQDELTSRLLQSPQLAAGNAAGWPLLSACLSPLPLAREDREWIWANGDEIKEGLGLLMAEGGDGWEAVGQGSGFWAGEEGEGEEEEWGSGDEYEEEEEEGEEDGEEEEEEEEGLTQRFGELSQRFASRGSGFRYGREGGAGEMEGEEVRGEEGEDSFNPASKLDELLYLSYMHRDQPDKSRFLKVAGSRLAFLGGFVLELALAEMLLQCYPREPVASLRERAKELGNKRRFPPLLSQAGLDRLVFPGALLMRAPSNLRQLAAKSVFTSLIASAYLTRGMPEVYRLLFEVFGLDPDHPDMRPKIERVRDEDFLHAELDGNPLTWRDVACYQSPPDSLFPNFRLFHACVPPGMSRFRGSDWMHRSLEAALRALAWPRPAEAGMSPEAKQRRNEDMVMALQLCFLHPSLHRAEHPRFCYDRLEYLGQKIQDLILAENLLQSHLDAPILWLADRHTKLLRNRTCGRYLRASGLHEHVELSDEVKQYFYANKKFQNLVSGAVFQALHGAAYIVYGKPEVRRLMFGIFEIDGGTMHTT
ncbi:hypothetical protein CLOM_g1491 [Closterium sp. NIES-68]|nr:hypothetical protein CLOM_g1491 [Closterium sp. NIES-68]GJP59399.1 hypothetical protein CLOP_g11766 [Closterium sp. NIES-67]